MRSRALVIAVVALLLPITSIVAADAPPKKPTPESGTYTWNSGQYTYDALGNIVAIGGDTYSYDANNRLIGATIKGPDGTQTFNRTYTYDIFGNLNAKSGDGGLNATIGVDTATNHLNAAGTTYDALGDVTTLHPPGSASTYALTYDPVGMLQSTIVDGGATQDFYVYTADDERLWTYDVKYNSSSVLVYEKSTFTVRDLGGNVLRRFEQTPTSLAWTLARDYYYRDGLLLSSAAGSTATVEHFTLDHLGTPRLITDSTKNKIGFHVYFPFGEEWFPATNVVQEAESRKFTGHERDRDLGSDNSAFDYMHARLYSSSSGRFLSVDLHPGSNARPQTWNRYTYGLDNPLRFTDPNGLEPIDTRMLQALSAFFGGRDFSNVQVHKGYFILPGFAALTIGNHVFVSPYGGARSDWASYKRADAWGVSTMVHEMVHVLQARNVGRPSFLGHWLVQTVASGFQHDKMPLESASAIPAGEQTLGLFNKSSNGIISTIQSGQSLSLIQRNLIAALGDLWAAQYAANDPLLGTEVPGRATSPNDPRSWENHYMPVMGTDGGAWLNCTDGDCR